MPMAEVIRNVVAEGVAADELGLDAFNVGEHHRDDFAISAPEVVLAAIAARTSQVKLASAVTVLSSDDPVRVYERFSTLDAISSGRAEVILGRGSFVESFPLFGYELSDYEDLFEEKLDLFARLREGGRITWEGKLRPSVPGLEVFPPLEHGKLPTWVAVGGSPQSVIRAAGHGLPLMLAIIGGSAARFAPYADLYRRALEQLGHDPQPIGYHSPGFVAATDEQARATYFPHYAAMHSRIGAERGWGPLTAGQYAAEVSESGALVVGSPETVARKVAAGIKTLGAARFDLKISSGTLPHEQILSSMQLYANQVVPRVRELVGA